MHLSLKLMLSKEGFNNVFLGSLAVFLAEDGNNHNRFKELKRCKT